MKKIITKYKILKLIYIFVLNFLNSIFYPIKKLNNLLDKLYLYRLIKFHLMQSNQLILYFENEIKFVVNSSDKVNSKKIYVGKFFPQMKEFDFAINYLEKNNFEILNLIDIGAHYGNISIPAFKKYNFNNVISIEPILENFKILNYNIVLNNLTKSITSFNYFISEKDGIVNIDTYSNNTAAATHSLDLPNKNLKNYKYFNNLKTSGSIEVVQKSLNSLFSDNKEINYKKTLIWIYAQGSEYKILKGSSNLLESKPPLVIAFNPVLLQKKDSNYLIKFIKIFEEYEYKSFYNLSKENNVLEDVNIKQLALLDNKLRKNLNTEFLLMI
jgi:FkbM family methyltransferase